MQTYTYRKRSRDRDEQMSVNQDILSNEYFQNELNNYL